MSNTAGTDGAVSRLGFKDGDVVQEIGWDEDVDETLRSQIEDLVGSGLEDVDYDGVVDAVVLWARHDDGDLTDDCVDALSCLDDKGFVLVLVPKAGHPDHVEAHEIAEAATTAGLKASSTVKLGDWIATKLVQGGVAKH